MFGFEGSSSVFQWILDLGNYCNRITQRDIPSDKLNNFWSTEGRKKLQDAS